MLKIIIDRFIDADNRYNRDKPELLFRTMNRTQLSQLVVFVTVAQTGSFRAAALRLGIAPSAVSHAISALETRMGIRLLARTTRATKPTEEGYLLLSRVNGPLEEIARALSELPELTGIPAGPLRITMPALAAEELIMPRLAEFMAEFPQIELDIRTSDVFEDIVLSGCDAGIRLGENLQADMIAVPLDGARRSLIVATPEYLKNTLSRNTPGICNSITVSAVVLRVAVSTGGNWLGKGIRSVLRSAGILSCLSNN